MHLLYIWLLILLSFMFVTSNIENFCSCFTDNSNKPTDNDEFIGPYYGTSATSNNHSPYYDYHTYWRRPLYENYF